MFLPLGFFMRLYHLGTLSSPQGGIVPNPYCHNLTCTASCFNCSHLFCSWSIGSTYLEVGRVSGMRIEQHDLPQEHKNWPISYPPFCQWRRLSYLPPREALAKIQRIVLLVQGDVSTLTFFNVSTHENSFELCDLPSSSIMGVMLDAFKLASLNNTNHCSHKIEILKI